ncbi:capsular biosynthesis protein [Massilia sp. Root351]|uniref:HAD-IIIC family phosphatase n=1 Tax=Massilia sp. Root351 TaxID=1736522 RepID=UPI000710FF55|nr:HAD-IIIC family phosphatase [Massilia sp. Root351]KQV89862.1 capsular biosynthesis protein [Massilia sp. Root351]
MKRIIIDLDDTLCTTVEGDYRNSQPVPEVIERLRWYHAQGFEIAINTSRNMRTYAGSLGKINANTLPLIIDWLARHEVPYDEIYVAKPWCGHDGFYVDDRAVRPDEFAKLDYEQLLKLIGKA